MEEKRLILDGELDAEGGTAIDLPTNKWVFALASATDLGGLQQRIATARRESQSADSKTELLSDSEMGGVSAGTPEGESGYDFTCPDDEYILVLKGGQHQRSAAGRTELAILSDNETNGVSAGMGFREDEEVLPMNAVDYSEYRDIPEGARRELACGQAGAAEALGKIVIPQFFKHRADGAEM